MTACLPPATLTASTQAPRPDFPANPHHTGQRHLSPQAEETTSDSRGTNLPRVGGYNQTVVLDAIRAHGPISRVELVPLTGLTAQTISNVVRRLLNKGLIEESGHAYSDGGKRRTLLSMRACGAYAVGVHLDPDFVVVALVNLAGDVVRSRRIRLIGPVDPADLVEQVARTVKRLVRDAAVDPDRVLGAGIATPVQSTAPTALSWIHPTFPAGARFRSQKCSARRWACRSPWTRTPPRPP
ncbi:MarR family transcriptional regulator [Streptomyces chiangmaiensis]